MFVTFKFNGVGISQLFRSDVDLLIGHRWEKGDHVIMPVVSDRGHLIREAGVFRRASHPFLKYCISECMKHLFGRKREHESRAHVHWTLWCYCHLMYFVCYQKDWVVGGGVGQSTGPVEEQVNQVVQIGHRAVQLSVWLVVSFQCVPTRKGRRQLQN